MEKEIIEKLASWYNGDNQDLQVFATIIIVKNNLSEEDYEYLESLVDEKRIAWKKDKSSKKSIQWMCDHYKDKSEQFPELTWL